MSTIIIMCTHNRVVCATIHTYIERKRRREGGRDERNSKKPQSFAKAVKHQNDVNVQQAFYGLFSIKDLHVTIRNHVTIPTTYCSHSTCRYLSKRKEDSCS